jgi:hypothetical protein
MPAPASCSNVCTDRSVLIQNLLLNILVIILSCNHYTKHYAALQELSPSYTSLRKNFPNWGRLQYLIYIGHPPNHSLHLLICTPSLRQPCRYLPICTPCGKF